MAKEPKIIFHHIPKCGGTSIVAGLALTYYPLRLLRYGRKGFPGLLNAPDSSQAAKEQNTNRYTFRRNLLAQNVDQDNSPLISGHYPFNPALYDKEKDQWHFITLLRDPLNRWYSEYFWNRHKDHDYRKTDLSIEAYLETEEGLENTRSFVNYFSCSENNSALVNTSERKEALNNLPKFNVIGCLEHLQRFKADMKSTFGRKPIFLKQNKSPAPKDAQKKPDENSDFHKKLLEYLDADIEIYAKAKEILKL